MKPNNAAGMDCQKFLVEMPRLITAAQPGRYPAYVKHCEATPEWAEMSSEPIIFD